ncbi:dephospho-CoA kinase [Nocardioides yefusunii]|uniref:Dephospho-CoA kinase n=1 Tax=Nocardioides yefusunii TaxID=2500546 RepID=A0ABW1QXW2_9ACTN|nr:dephospho-CoA kinase [Nocardioides yefusunii]
MSTPATPTSAPTAAPDSASPVRRIALTGGIASGKSTVSTRLAALGAVVVDADLLAREVVAPGTPGFADVVAEFGESVLAADGSLDRPALGAIVFADGSRRRALEAIIHPLVHAAGAALEAAAPADALVVHDIPLLAEGGRAGEFDAVVVVDVPEELQVERMVRDRGMSQDDARARLAAQASREQRLAIADVVIDNSGTREALTARVDEVFAELTRRRS